MSMPQTRKPVADDKKKWEANDTQKKQKLWWSSESEFMSEQKSAVWRKIR